MQYEFKVLPEVLWAALVGAGTAGLEILIHFDPEVIADWETWAIASGAALVRAAAAAALPVFIRIVKVAVTGVMGVVVRIMS